MIQGFKYMLNRNTGLMTVDDTVIEDVDRFVLQDTDAPHSIEIDDEIMTANFSVPVEAEIREEDGEKQVVVSQK